MTDDIKAIWVWKFGPIMLGRVDALDGGWTDHGKPVRFMVNFTQAGMPWTANLRLDRRARVL